LSQSRLPAREIRLRARFHPHQRGRVAHATPWTWGQLDIRRGNRKVAALEHQASRAKPSRLPYQHHTPQLGREKDVTVAVAAPDGAVTTPAGSESGLGQGGPHPRTMILALTTRRLAPQGGPHPRTMRSSIRSSISFHKMVHTNQKQLGPFG